MDCCTVITALVVIYILYRIINYLLYLPLLGDRENKYVFITGCGHGFGHEAVIRLDRSGLNVFAGCRSESQETELRKKCSKRLKTVHIDIGKLDTIQKAYEYVKANIPEGKGLWGVINNAGIGGSILGPADWHKPEDYLEVFNINVLGIINVNQAFMPLIKQAKGRIVNVGSLGGLSVVLLDMKVAYTMSKHCLEAYNDVLRLNMKPFGVKVIMVNPGSYKTNISTKERFDVGYEESWNRLSPETQKEYGREYLDGYMHKWGDLFMDARTTDISPVLDAYEHALMARYPRSRYWIGKEGPVIRFFRTIPTWLSDFLYLSYSPKPYIAALKK